MRNNCMFLAPRELTGTVEMCIRFQNNCNGYGKDCLGYKKHTKESLAALAKAIEIRRKNREELELKYGGIG